MRTIFSRTCVAMGTLLALVGLTSAQDATTFFTGVSPRNINFKPVDVGKYNKAGSLQNSLRTPNMPGAYNLQSSMPKLTLGSWPPRLPNVSILPQKNNIFQPKPPTGIKPFEPTPAKKK